MFSHSQAYLQQPLSWNQSLPKSPMQRSPQEQQTTQKQLLLHLPPSTGHFVHSNPPHCHQSNEMENECEWYMLSIQRAVNRAFEKGSLSILQLQKILSG